MRCPELWAWPSALVAISRPAAAAIDKGLIIIEGAPSVRCAVRCGSATGLQPPPPILPAAPPSPAATPGHGVAFRRHAAEACSVRRALLPGPHGLCTIASPRPRAEPRIGRERHGKNARRSALMRLKARLYL